MTKTYEKLEEKLKNSKPTITGKEVKIDKDTYDTLNKFMNTSKRVIKESSNNKALFKELEEYTNSYRDLENENRNIKYEVNRLKYENLNLKYENSKLYKLITALLERFKHFFHEILKFGSERHKYEVVDTITDLYEQNLYKQTDLYDITDNTSKKEHINSDLKVEKKKNIYDEKEISI